MGGTWYSVLMWKNWCGVHVHPCIWLMYMFLWFVLMYVQVHMSVHVGTKCWCSLSSMLSLYSLRWVSHWAWNSLTQLRWPTNPRESIYFQLPRVYYAWLSRGCLELKLRYSCLCSENFTHWPIPQPLVLIFSKGNPSKHLQKWYSWKGRTHHIWSKMFFVSGSP